jgi:enoyl-CoA hydratase/carnithine racemase
MPESGGPHKSIVVERRGAVEILTLARPAALNALNEGMVTELTAYFAGLSDRLDVRVVVLRGQGRAFCAGLDLKGWPTQPPGEGAIQHGWRMQRMIARVIRLMRSCPQPIIGLGHGAACGGGFSLLLACDVRYAAPNLRMNAAYIKVGVGGCDIGSSYLLPRLVGLAIASELILTGRFIDAERACRVNLVNDIVPEAELLDAGLALAGEMLDTAPLGLRLSKDALNLNIDAVSLESAMALEDRQQVMLLQGADHREAVAAFLEKRPPVYRDC